MNWCIYWTACVTVIKFAGYVAWILTCKRCKFGGKICYKSRDIEFFLGDYYFLVRPVDLANGVLCFYSLNCNTEVWMYLGSGQPDLFDWVDLRTQSIAAWPMHRSSANYVFVVLILFADSMGVWPISEQASRLVYYVGLSTVYYALCGSNPWWSDLQLINPNLGGATQQIA